MVERKILDYNGLSLYDSTLKEYLSQNKEDKSNKVAEISGAGNNVSYPNTKAVVDYVNSKLGSIFRYKGSIYSGTLTSLTGMQIGDVYNLADDVYGNFTTENPDIICNITDTGENLPMVVTFGVDFNDTSTLNSFSSGDKIYINDEYITLSTYRSDMYWEADYNPNINTGSNISPSKIEYNLSLRPGDNVVWIGHKWDMLAASVSLTGVERTYNKTQSLSSSSTNTQYPSAKAVVDYVKQVSGSVYDFMGSINLEAQPDSLPQASSVGKGAVYNIGAGSGTITLQDMCGRVININDETISLLNPIPLDGLISISFINEDTMEVRTAYSSNVILKEYDATNKIYTYYVYDALGSLFSTNNANEIWYAHDLQYTLSYAPGDNIISTGSYWDNFGSYIDLSNYATKADITEKTDETQVREILAGTIDLGYVNVNNNGRITTPAIYINDGVPNWKGLVQCDENGNEITMEDTLASFLTNEDKQELQGNIDEVNSALGSLSTDGGIPQIEGTDIATKCSDFSLLLKDTSNIESFIFYTDPHLVNGSNYDDMLHEYLETVRNYHYTTPTSFVVCGGDWLGNSDTYEQACFKLGYIDGLVRHHFDRHYQVIGNHDTNQQGVDETGGSWTGLLPIDTVHNLFTREHGKSYYTFDGSNSRCYVLDSWKEESAMTDYRWEQVKWLGECLKTDDAENSILFTHMGFVGGSTEGTYVAHAFTNNITALCKAYNNRSTITLNGVTYYFSGCTGCVRFALSSHIHNDYMEVVNDIPVIATMNMRKDNTPTFDLCLADYKNNKLNLVRVGSGENRIIDMANIEEADSGVYTVGGNIVFLSRCNHNGAGINYYDREGRALVVTTENTGVAFAVGSGSTDVTHYAMKIPEGATKVTLNTPNDVCAYCIGEIRDDGGFPSATATAGGTGNTLTHTFTGTYSHFMFQLKKIDDSHFDETYDGSGITWTFEYE